MKTMNVVQRALIFASRAHEGQKRKYTGEDYIVHPIAVSNIVLSITDDDNMRAAALLHDTVEDTDVDIIDILREFGADIAELVLELTDVSKPEDGNRAFRKNVELERLAKVSADAQTIKLADLIDNTKSIVEHDPKFAKVYLEEKRALLLVLTKGDASLHKIASEQTRQDELPQTGE